MNKRGQLYIFAALIIILVIFWVSLKTNLFQKTEVSPTFEQLSQNYENEVSRMVNNLLQEGVAPEILADEISEISSDFVYTYAKQKDPDFGLVYVLSNKDQVIIENNLDTRLVVKGLGELASPEESCVEGGIIGAAADIPTGATKKWCVENIDPTTLANWGDSFIPTEKTIPRMGDTIIINIEDSDYYFTIGDSVELKAIVRREAEDQVQVYITGEE